MTIYFDYNETNGTTVKSNAILYRVEQIELAYNNNNLGVYVRGQDPNWQYKVVGRVITGITKIYLFPNDSRSEDYKSYDIKEERDLRALINTLEVKVILDNI